MQKVQNNRAWWLVLPVFLLVAFSALIPLMTVVNYSVQDIFGPGQAFFVGTEWFKEVLTDERLQDSLIRQFIFSGAVLLIQIPLGIGVALMMPKSGIKGSLCLILLAIPLLIPWNVVGTIWQIFARGDIGLFGWGINQLGIDYNYTGDTLDAWLTVLLMDVWHWTPLVALLCYSGLRAIPEAFYQAAEIDRASKLHRAFCADWWWSRQFHDLPEPDSYNYGHRAVRSRARGRVLADLFPDRLADFVALLYRHYARRQRKIRRV